MSDNESSVQFERLGGFLRSIEALQVLLQPHLPSVRLECLSGSPEPIDVYLGEWNGTQFAETFLKTVNPGETFSRKLDSIEEFSNFKKGHSLMVRVKKNVGLYNLKNMESYFGYALTVTPPVYPWWQPQATVVRWGPKQPYLVQPSATFYSDIVPTWQDVFYYRPIG
ncbi:MAG TPA: hypothetical protein VLS25_13805 [Dehalococcoidia bacterium]|nr:hypothetical protein [Dehalococcoidia bacterium]